MLSMSFTFTIGLPFDDSLHEPLNLTAEATESLINLNWEEPFTCPDGQFADCIGQCIEDWYEAWLGDGLCDEDAVRFTVTHGPEAIQWLIDNGVPFTPDPDPSARYPYHLTREGVLSST